MVELGIIYSVELEKKDLQWMLKINKLFNISVYMFTGLYIRINVASLKDSLECC